ncbi:hypothetical protein STEG23_020651, partial [Scotinomys teguina]
MVLPAVEAGYHNKRRDKRMKTQSSGEKLGSHTLRAGTNYLDGTQSNSMWDTQSHQPSSQRVEAM